MTKFELSISTSYVPNWGVAEAMRELFQNALDNEIENPENKVSVIYDNRNKTFSISNKTSALQAQSLLLGCTTKANDSRTIGQHGEGYKIAFMVLLRNDKKVTVYNYGAREVWNVKLVNSKKYNNQRIVNVIVDKAHIWNKVPDNDLTIVVEGITDEEYRDIVRKNLNLRYNKLNTIDTGLGKILKDGDERGNIYVKGLFVCNKSEFGYGYDFNPGVVKLDRDRRILDSISISFETSAMWNEASKINKDIKEEMIEMFKRDIIDVRYVTASWTAGRSDANNYIASDFIEEYGEDAIPVSSNSEYNAIKDSGKKPIIVNEKIKEAVESSDVYEYKKEYIASKTLKELFMDFMGEIESVLTDDQLKYMQELINKITN